MRALHPDIVSASSELVSGGHVSWCAAVTDLPTCRRTFHVEVLFCPYVVGIRRQLWVSRALAEGHPSNRGHRTALLQVLFAAPEYRHIGSAHISDGRNTSAVHFLCQNCYMTGLFVLEKYTK
jgi:hypothetical protein